MRVIVTGGQGMLGRTFTEIAAEYSGLQIFALGRREFDITDGDAIKNIFAKYKPQLLVHTAAIPDPEIVANDLGLANKINVQASGMLADACCENRVKMAFICSDYVYDGRKNGDYCEDDVVNPVNDYGQQKLQAEQLIMNKLREAFSIRTAVLYGADKLNYVDKVLNALSAGSEIKAPVDQICNPTYTRDLARAILDLAVGQNYGIYHIANRGHASRYDFFCKIAEFAGKSTKGIVPVKLVECGKPVMRPLNTALDVSKVEKQLGYKLREWQVALQEYVKNK